MNPLETEESSLYTLYHGDTGLPERDCADLARLSHRPLLTAANRANAMRTEISARARILSK